MVKRKTKRKRSRSRAKIASGRVKDDSRLKIGGKTYVLLAVYGNKAQAKRIAKLTTDPTSRSGAKAVVRKHRNGWAVYKY